MRSQLGSWDVWHVLRARRRSARFDRDSSMRYISWRILTYRLTVEQSKHRVAIWRELRRVGALALQQATWAIPPGDAFDSGLTRAIKLVERSGGRPLLFSVVPDDTTSATLEELYTAEREAEWLEFLSECDKAEAELHREIDQRKFTLAELDEEEQNIDRLRRWQRELRAKDLFGAPSAAPAEQRFRDCASLLETFAAHVFEARERP
jgi:hypothetical protein